MNPATNIPRAELVTVAAEVAGVCARPVIAEVTDLDGRNARTVPIACGATRASKCKPCAERARKLRMQQCREGWHLDHEPEPSAPPDYVDDDDQAGEDEGERRVRSTRRRQDAPDLPRADMDPTTIGRTFTGPDGKVWRPSMFVTLTLPGYGRATSEGVPVDPGSYDYRRAALDAIHFSKLVDGSGRTCGAAPATGSSTSPPSRASAAVPRTFTLRPGVPFRGG